MRRALLLSLALAAVPTPSAGQLPRIPNPLEALMGKPPLVVTVPAMTVLDGGRAEALVDSRLTWPAKPDATFALTLRGGMVARAGTLYSRSGIETALRAASERASWHADVAVDIGSGNGARQVLTMTLGGAWDALALDVRTTWFNDAPADTGNAFFDRAVGPFATNALVDGRYTDAELHGQHTLGRLHAQVVGGTRFGGNGNGPARWAWGELQHPVWQQLSIIAAAGLRPYRAEYGSIGGRFAELRMQWRTSKPNAVRTKAIPSSQPMLVVLPLTADSFRLQLHAPGATAVAVKGDFTAWRSVPMERSGAADAWWLDVRAPAGTYHINMRTQDGIWVVPPGLVAVPDGFGGSAGLIKFTTADGEEQ